MIELLKILLSLSLSGSLIILVLLLCKPLYKNKLSRQWQYYIWLIVVARLLLAFTPEVSLVGSIFQGVEQTIVQIFTAGQSEPNIPILPDTNLTEHETPSDNQNSMINVKKSLAQRIFEMSIENAWLILGLVWLMVMTGLLIRKITVYQSFVKYIKAGSVEITDMRLWEQLGKLVEQAGIKTTVELYANSLISSPLLIGFIKPCIMLPSAELSGSDYYNTILHELTHYKRLDMFYKWLVQVMICLHWFNPFVHLMGKEINRACEFSCDEAIIKMFDKEKQRAYGDTLLSAIGIGGTYNDSLASVTLNENAELLKERLDAIMGFRKKTGLVTCFTTLLTMLLLCGFTFTGAYAMDNGKKIVNSQNINVANNSDVVLSGYSFFLIGGNTPAIKPTFTNNTPFEIIEIAVGLDYLDKGAILTAKTNIPVKSGENVTHSGWGLGVGVEKIRLGIRSYTTKDGKVYTIENNKILWYDLNVNFIADSHSVSEALNGYETIAIDNPSKDDASYLELNWLKGYYYYAYGPFYAGKQAEEKDVIFNVKNEIDGQLLIATAKNKECVNGINNTFSSNSSYSGSISIITNDDGYYYVIVGAKDIRNLKGTIQVPQIKIQSNDISDIKFIKLN